MDYDKKDTWMWKRWTPQHINWSQKNERYTLEYNSMARIRINYDSLKDDSLKNDSLKEILVI